MKLPNELPAESEAMPKSGRRNRPWLGWLAVVLLPAIVLILARDKVSPWVLMWLLTVAIFYSFKCLSWTSSHLPRSTWARRLGFWFAWPGMDAARFLNVERLADAQRPTRDEWVRSVGMIVFGAVIFYLGVRLIGTGNDYIAAWCGMFGLLFALHFGAIHLISCACAREA